MGSVGVWLAGAAIGAVSAMAAAGELSGGPEPDPMGTGGRLVYEGRALGIDDRSMQS